MTISSVGIGSGLDVKSMITQLTDLEKQPLKALQTQADKLQTQLSTVGQIKSKVGDLVTAVTGLSSVVGWKGVSVSNSNPSAVSVTASAGALATSYSVSVSRLAKAQTLSLSTSAPALDNRLAAASQAGYGQLTITVGGVAKVVSIPQGEGTLTQIASKINATSGIGVSAAIMRDGSGLDNLIITSKTTGSGGAITIAATEGGVDSNLSRFTYGGSSPQMVASQPAEDALGTINGVSVTSSSNSFSSVLPNVSMTFSQVTTSPVQVVVSQDKDSITKNLTKFVDAYNSVNALLNDSTKYDIATKTAGVLQGDAVINGLSIAFRKLLGSSASTGSTFTNLASVGISAKLGGDLSVDTDKWSAAMGDLPNLQLLFTAYNGSDATNGIALTIKSFANGLLGSDGGVTNKTSAIQKNIKNNTAEQDKVNKKASLAQDRLNKQYSALDGKMSSLNSLSSYVSQQVTTWNQSKN